MHRKQFCPYCGFRFPEQTLEGMQRPYCEQCRMSITGHPVPSTCAVVVDGCHQILLQIKKVASKTGQWSLPGGFLQSGESPERSALRMLKDQTGLDGQIELLLGVTTHPGETVDTVLMIGYLVAPISGKPAPGSDVSRLDWFHPDRLPPLAYRSHQRFIRMYYAACPGGDPMA